MTILSLRLLVSTGRKKWACKPQAVYKMAAASLETYFITTSSAMAMKKILGANFMLCFGALMLFLVAENLQASDIVAAAPAGNNQVQRGASEGSLRPEECGGRCMGRCSNTAYKKPCLFFCNKCCAKCLCVPPGTYGNKQLCPCYNNWKTQTGGPKCP